MIKSNFNYCPLVWMFCSGTANRRINNIHERSLRIVSDDYDSTFENLLILNVNVTIHQRNLQLLATEIYKISNKLSPPIMQDMFHMYENIYNLRNFHEIATIRRNTTLYALETLSYRSSVVWSLRPAVIKVSSTLAIFKNRIKSWKCEDCPFKQCKSFISNHGLLYIRSYMSYFGGQF